VKGLIRIMEALFDCSDLKGFLEDVEKFY